MRIKIDLLYYILWDRFHDIFDLNLFVYNTRLLKNNLRRGNLVLLLYIDQICICVQFYVYYSIIARYIRLKYQYFDRINTHAQPNVTLSHKLVNRPGGVFYGFAPLLIFSIYQFEEAKKPAANDKSSSSDLDGGSCEFLAYIFRKSIIVWGPTISDIFRWTCIQTVSEAGWGIALWFFNSLKTVSSVLHDVPEGGPLIQSRTHLGSFAIYFSFRLFLWSVVRICCACFVCRSVPSVFFWFRNWEFERYSQRESLLTYLRMLKRWTISNFTYNKQYVFNFENVYRTKPYKRAETH